MPDRKESLIKKQSAAFEVFATAAENCLKTYKLPHNLNEFTLSWASLLQGIAVSVINDRMNGFLKFLSEEPSNEADDLNLIVSRLTSILLYKEQLLSTLRR